MLEHLTPKRTSEGIDFHAESTNTTHSEALMCHRSEVGLRPCQPPAVSRVCLRGGATRFWAGVRALNFNHCYQPPQKMTHEEAPRPPAIQDVFTGRDARVGICTALTAKNKDGGGKNRLHPFSTLIGIIS